MHECSPPHHRVHKQGCSGLQSCKRGQVPVLLASGSLAEGEMQRRRMAAVQQVTAWLAHLSTVVRTPDLTYLSL